MVEFCYHYLETIKGIKVYIINIFIIMEDQGNIHKVETVLRICLMYEMF